MRLFDTHAHLSLDIFDEDRAEVLSRMREAGVARALVVADATEDVPGMLKLIEENDFLYGGVGVHPHNARAYSAEAEAVLLQALKHPKCRVLGEIGLDYHYDLSPRDAQRAAFDRQLELAFTLKMPVQLHIREAHGDNIEMLTKRAAEGRLPAGILHCYTGSWESAKTYLELGFYLSLSGAVTFKNAPKLAEVAKNTPADRLLIETDCPYMAPVPMRSKRNEPAFVRFTLEKIAELRGADADALAETTYENANRIFELNG